MSAELTEMLETLQTEKERYKQLEQQSMCKLLELSVADPTKVTDELLQERERIEAEIQMLRNLMDYIDFKRKLLNVNEFAS